MALESLLSHGNVVQSDNIVRRIDAAVKEHKWLNQR